MIDCREYNLVQIGPDSDGTARRGRQHVLVGIPHIALLVVVGLGILGGEHDRHQPLEPLVTEAGHHDGGKGEVEGGFAAMAIDVHHMGGDGWREAETIEKMHQPVEVIAVPAQCFLGCKTTQCLRVGRMSAGDMFDSLGYVYRRPGASSGAVAPNMGSIRHPLS